MEGEKEDLRRGPFVIAREHRHVRPVTNRHVGISDVNNTRTCCNWVLVLSRPQISCGRGKRAGKARRDKPGSVDGTKKICSTDLRREGGREARRMLSSTCAMCEIRPIFLCPHTMNRWDLYNPRP